MLVAISYSVEVLVHTNFPEAWHNQYLGIRGILLTRKFSFYLNRTPNFNKVGHIYKDLKLLTLKQ